MMQYTITFTGGDPIVVSEDKAEALKLALASVPKPEYVEIGKRLTKTTTIRSIEPWTTESKSDARMEEFEKDKAITRKKHLEGRNKRLAMTPYDRARVPDLTRLVLMAFCNEMGALSDADMEEIFRCSEEYFIKNPDKSFANPICYKHVLDRNEKRPDTRHPEVVRASMQFIERVLSSDI